MLRNCVKRWQNIQPNVGGDDGADPTIDKDELIQRILETIDKTEEFLTEKGKVLQELIFAADFIKLQVLLEMADAVSGSMADKKRFTTYASELIRLMKYIDRDDITDATRKQYEAIRAIYGQLQKKRKHTHTTGLMKQINDIISEHVEIENTPNQVSESGESTSVGTRRFDISAINFTVLSTEFAKLNNKNLMMKDLEDVIQKKLARLLISNPNRIDYYERYQAIIEAYNAEQDRATIEKTFMELMKLAQELDQEEQRYIREGFTSDEELSLYDMLLRENLSKAEIKKIKEVAIDLYNKIQVKIAELDHWKDKEDTRAEVDVIIRNTLWKDLPESYDDNSLGLYRQQIYEYVYTRF
ncbi:type I restriction enzyme endonuclease domain-containing protein [Veillonella sp.]|uniref:type I restriction enzyme endonuclease domain-containing protein n=1 Tax=Veillonella sp. TaxID=1926307 RepID=UPI0025F06211|nr:type I restriction enzyme endonuclease domain-containing protein [Veillonella sp.]